MAGIINGKDIQDGTIILEKLSTNLQNQLIPHNKVTSINLSTDGSSGSLTFDGITGTVTNTDGTFLTIAFTSSTELTNVDMVRTVYANSGNSSQRLDGQTLGSTPISFPPLTIGANLKVEIEIIIENTIYNIVAGGTVDLSRCWGYVEKI